MSEHDSRGQESPAREPNRADTEAVLIPTVDRSVLHFHRERVAGVPICGPLASNYERRPRADAAEYAEPCERCFGDGMWADSGEGGGPA